MGDGYPQMVLTVVTMFVGLFLIVLFAHKKIKGSVLLGMLCASGIYWAGEAIFLHTNPFASLKARRSCLRSATWPRDPVQVRLCRPR